MNNLCRITYDAPGAPLSVILTEASIRTSCDLTTYEPEYTDEIPFDRHTLAFKTIMRGSWLYDAILELSSTSPEKLTLYAKTLHGTPFFALSATGTLGSARVDFHARPPAPAASAAPSLLETFQLADPHAVLRASYSFALVQKAARAMSVAAKVSVRVDAQSVLSLQFLVEGDAGSVSFVDFRFVPLLDEEGEGEETVLEGGVGDAE